MRGRAPGRAPPRPRICPFVCVCPSPVRLCVIRPPLVSRPFRIEILENETAEGLSNRNDRLDA